MRPSKSEWVQDRVRHRLLARRFDEAFSWREILHELELLDPTHVGFDVFDTVLVRRVVAPTAAEAITGRRLIDAGVWPHDAGDYLVARAAAFRLNPSGSLEDWYRSAPFRDLSSVAEALDLEIDTERSLLVASPGAGEAVAKIRERWPITFVSDMHLRSDTLRALLGEHGLIEPADGLVVSCEHDATKADGSLYAELWKAARASTRRADGPPVSEPVIAYIGNSEWNDVTKAAGAGAKPIPATMANPSRYELAMTARVDGPGVAVAGAARLARLTASNEAISDTDDEPYIEALGAEVLGQLMVPFLLWVRQQCEAHDIHHAAFLARDGEVPLDVARAMPADHWTGIDLSYLHCGRRSWSLAAASVVGVREWINLGTGDGAAFLRHSATLVPLASLLHRCGLVASDLPPDDALAAADPTAPLPDSESWAVLLRSGKLDDLIFERSAAARDRIVDFLRQQSLPKDRLALVDVGWRGQQAWMISALLREATGCEALHLHFGGDGVILGIDDRTAIRRFALDDSIRPHPIDGVVSALEMFLASGKPRLLRYERGEDGVVREVFEEQSSEVDTEARHRLIDGALDVARLLPTRAEMASWGLDEEPLIEEVRRVLELFWTAPIESEAHRLRDLRFEADDSGEIIGHVVRPYSPRELLGRAAIPRQWPHGSLAVTPEPLRTAVRGYLWGKRRRSM